jgi:UrcA family protein
MNASTRSILAATIFAALTCGIVTMSFASDGPDAFQVKVKYGDLDASSASGATTLYKRILGAAETVCHPLKNPDLYPRKLFYICMRKAMSNAVNEVNEPVLFTIANANANANANAGADAPKVIVTSNRR